MTSLQLPFPESETILEQILRNNEIGKKHFTSYETPLNVIRMEDLTKADSLHKKLFPYNEPVISYQPLAGLLGQDSSLTAWSTEKTVHAPIPEAEWQSKFGARHQTDKNKKHFVRKDDPLSGAWLNVAH